MGFFLDVWPIFSMGSAIGLGLGIMAELWGTFFWSVLRWIRGMVS